MFSKCYTANSGGYFHMPVGSTFQDTSSTFKLNAAVNGGAIYCLSCSLTFTSTTFRDHIAREGGMIYMTDTSTLALDDITITQSKARVNGGGIYASGSGA